MGYRLGVDLGTTFTAAAIDDGAGPVMVGLGNRAMQIPSVLFLKDDGDFLCGEAAERRAGAQPDRAVREFKRRLGDTVPILVAGQPYSPQTLSARLLRWVVDTVAERQGSRPDDVVLTYPANWGEYKRALLDQVISLADLPTATTCTEPEAAAIQYARRSRLSPGDRVAVYDLGGGTFDVCVLLKQDIGFAILGSPDGVEHLGGIDFDEAVFRHVLAQLEETTADLDPLDEAVTAALTRLRRDCVEAKEALSNDLDAVIPVTLPGNATSVRLTRAELEGLIRPPLKDTLAATRRALRSADTTVAQLAGVVLVGGSSRIPLVSQLLQSELGVRTALDTHPKHDIALGAVQYQREPATRTPLPAAEMPRWPTRTPAPSRSDEPDDAPATRTAVLPRVDASDDGSEPPSEAPALQPLSPKPQKPEHVRTPSRTRMLGRAPLVAVVVAILLISGVIGTWALSSDGGSGGSPEPSSAPSGSTGSESPKASANDTALEELKLTRVSYNDDKYSDVAIQSRSAPGKIITLLSTGKEFAAPDEWARVATPPEGIAIHRLNGDFNGDHRTDAAILKDDGQGGVRAWVRLSTGVGADARFDEPRPWGQISDVSGNEIVPLSGDFDGNGRMDLLIAKASNAGMSLILLLSQLESDVFEQSNSGPDEIRWGYGRKNSKVLGGDFNDDGKTDLVALVQVKDTITIQVALAEANGFGAPKTVEKVSDALLSDTKPLTGDFNGDGLTDLVLFSNQAEGGSNATFYGGDERGAFVLDPNDWWSNAEVDVKGSWFSVGDFNADGMADVARITDSNESGVDVYVLLSETTTSTRRFKPDGVWGRWASRTFNDVFTLTRVG